MTLIGIRHLLRGITVWAGPELRKLVGAIQPYGYTVDTAYNEQGL